MRRWQPVSAGASRKVGHRGGVGRAAERCGLPTLRGRYTKGGADEPGLTPQHSHCHSLEECESYQSWTLDPRVRGAVERWQ